MVVKVVIVDDLRRNIRHLKNAVEGYESIFADSVFYRITESFGGRFAFQEAKQFILAKEQEIDILMVDYNLEDGYGTDLLKLLTGKYKIYRILHSITDDTLDTNLELHMKLYDDFCKSKDEQKIKKVISKYENEIVTIKLNGNPFFRSPKYRLNDNGKTRFSWVSFQNILYAESTGGDYIRITYIKHDKIHNDKEVSGYRLTDFTGSKYPFHSLHSKLVINLLWVAGFNYSNKTITFITPDNSRLELPFLENDVFEIEIKPQIKNIIGNIPVFFSN